ncbi:MAG TPA: hypothetical protein DCF62_04970 [Porticoccaceae bacterium]|nr:hypothetical protein [Porticoccaceae bacterium]
MNKNDSWISGQLKRWHRRLGLCAALFVLVLAATGLTLNHTSELDLDSKQLNWSVLLAWYGIESSSDLYSFPLGQQLVTLVGEELFVDTREIAHCSGQLSGAQRLPGSGLAVLACGDELFVLTPELELVERLGSAHGLPSPLSRIGLAEAKLVISNGARFFWADIETLSWEAVPEAGQAIQDVAQWSSARATPPELSEALGKHFVGEGLSLERILLDIHSGRILGGWGVYLMDAMAIVFIVLAVSGLLMWRREAKSRE